MFKEVKYDQPFVGQKRKSVYHQEYKLLQDFHSGEKRNMRFEYSNYNEAKNATAAILRYAKQTRTPLNVSQRGNFVFVTRKESEEQ